MRIFETCVCVLVALSLSGCYPEERIWWSPKGDRAIVRVEDRLHLVNADGALGVPLLGGASVRDWLAPTISWLPDGTGFVCTRVRKVSSWEETKKLIPADEAKKVEEWLPVVLPTLAVVIAANQPVEGLGGLISAAPNSLRLLLTAAVRVVFQRQRGELEHLLKRLPNREKIIAELADAAAGFEVHELCIVRLDRPVDEPPQSLARALFNVPVLPKVSPKHAALAFLQLRDGDDETIDLKVMTLDGKALLTVEQDVSTAAFEWLPDGRALIFTTSLSKTDGSIQTIRQTVALQESGTLMKPQYDAQPDGSLLKVEGPDRLPKAKSLAMAIMQARPMLQVLPDGRILFASQSATLPVAGTGPELEPRLYLIATDGSSVHAIPTAPGDLPKDLNFFVASPDGQRIAVVEEGTDAVTLVEVSTGKRDIIAAPHPRWSCATIPAWKSATELTFAGLDEPTKRPRMLLWTAGSGVRNISQQWPPDATDDWLSERKPDAP